MKVSHLASKIAKSEGLKKQVSIGNVREIIALICDAMVSDSGEIILALVANGKRRARRKKKS